MQYSMVHGRNVFLFLFSVQSEVVWHNNQGTSANPYTEIVFEWENLILYYGDPYLFRKHSKIVGVGVTCGKLEWIAILSVCCLLQLSENRQF